MVTRSPHRAAHSQRRYDPCDPRKRGDTSVPHGRRVADGLHGLHEPSRSGKIYVMPLAVNPTVNPDVAMRSRAPVARRRYIELTERAAEAVASGPNPRFILKSGTAWLELFYLSALFWEYVQKHEIHTLDQLQPHGADLDRHVRAMFPNVVAVTQEIASILGDVPNEDLPRDWSMIQWSQVVRSFDAIVAECPIDRFEALGRELDEPRLAHRARCAYDGLRAFVRRHNPERAEVMRIVGEQYQRGNIRLRDAATLLGMPVSDAVFELEQDGFGRAQSAIVLTDTERDAIYQRLRNRRLQEHTRHEIDPDLIDRDVIASERIEGVDARAWIRR